MKLIFSIISRRDSANRKEYAILIQGQFPITSYRHACKIEDEVIRRVDAGIKNRKLKKRKLKNR